MNTLQGTLLPDGALVEVSIGLPGTSLQVLRQAKQPVPQPVMARALIDPGAELSAFDTQVLAPLLTQGLKPSRIILANMPATGGLQPVREFSIGLAVIHPSGQPRFNLVVRNLLVLEQTLGPLGYQALIGRDVLERCLFVYDGPGQRFTLAY